MRLPSSLLTTSPYRQINVKFAHFKRFKKSMKISYNWLKNYVDISVSPEQLGEILTDTGLEVEGISKIEAVKGDFKVLLLAKFCHVKNMLMRIN